MALVKHDGSILVGHEAEREAQKYSADDFAIYSLKRVLDKTRAYEWGDTQTYPHILTAIILAELKIQAEIFLGEEVSKAVISVPANFNFLQRQFTKGAALIAGLEPHRIINEASAAVFSLQENIEGTVVAADLGRGTFDVTAISCGDGVYEVLVTDGDDALGGDDFTDAMYTLILKKSGMQPDGSLIRSDPLTHRRVRDAAEEAKKELSSSLVTKVYVPYIERTVGYDTIGCSITREEFVAKCDDLLTRIERITQEVLVAPRLRDLSLADVPRNMLVVPAEKHHKLFDFGIWLIGNASRTTGVADRLQRKCSLLRPPTMHDLIQPVALGAAKLAGCLMFKR